MSMIDNGLEDIELFIVSRQNKAWLKKKLNISDFHLTSDMFQK